MAMVEPAFTVLPPVPASEPTEVITVCNLQRSADVNPSGSGHEPQLMVPSAELVAMSVPLP